MMWFIVGAYQWGVLFADLLYLLYVVVVLTLQSLWRIISPSSPKAVTGEVVLVTGAGHGIGRELALQFARLGAKVVCWDVNKENNDATVAEIKKEGGWAWGFYCDVSKKEEVADASKKTRLAVGDVSILINNAGTMYCKPFMKHSEEEIIRLHNINVLSHYWTIQEWLPIFLGNGGHIVAISSECGYLGTPFLAPYCSTKFAVRGLMEGLSEELRYCHRNASVKLTRVHPYTVNTGLAPNPRVRFPSLFPVISAEQCAATVIDGVRRDEEIIFVPRRDFYNYRIFSILPRKVQHAVMDFVDSGVDPSDT